MKKKGCAYVRTFSLCLCFMNIYVSMFWVNLQYTNINIMIMFEKHLYLYLYLDYDYILWVFMFLIFYMCLNEI